MGKESPLNLKCEPERAEELHGQYDDIKLGWHMSKIHWNTVAINNEVPGHTHVKGD
jgi:predicted DNA-binding protein (MmcQ/YjbR family)